MKFQGQFTLVANFHPIDGKSDDLQQLMEASMENTINAPGLIQAFTFKPEKPLNPFVFVAIWESKKHFQDFMKSPAAQAAHQKNNLKHLHETAIKDTQAELYTVHKEWHVAH